jgi:regulator of sigma E protease
MLGGVTMNLLMAFVIYAMILYTWGEKKIPMSGLTYGVAVTDSLMYDMGFRDGDKILSVNGETITYFDDLTKKLLLGQTVVIERDGMQKTINLPVNLIGKLIEKKRTGRPFFLPRVPVIADLVPDTSNAYKAGLRRLDQVTTVDGIATPFYDEYKKAVGALIGEVVTITVDRNGNTDTLHASVTEDGALGFYRLADPEIMDSLGLIKIERKEYGFLASFPAGIHLAGETLGSYIDQFKKVLSPETGAYKGVGGFKAIGSIFPSMWDWQSFWTITAFLSVILAFMNILPIPALDGGHVLFTLLEIITGRKPSQKVLEYAQVIGMVILLGLMIYANFNDWFGWGRGK